MTPFDYVIEKFKTHDVVLLGEQHGVKDNLIFIHSLIPALYESGVRTIGMEFGAEEDQTTLDALTSGESEVFDHELARNLMFNYNVRFPNYEYYETYEKVWAFNRGLPEDAENFRILNLSYVYDWSDYKGEQSPFARAKVFHRGEIEEFRFNLLKWEILDQNKKILILTGSVHAFTKFNYPVYDPLSPGFVRYVDTDMGHRLYQSAGDKVCVLLLHQGEWPVAGQPPSTSAETAVEAILGSSRMGVDTNQHAIGDVPITGAFVMDGKERTLKDICDGYLYLAPIHRLEKCTVDRNFLEGHSYDEVLNQWPDPSWGPAPADEAAYWACVEA